MKEPQEGTVGEGLDDTQRCLNAADHAAAAGADFTPTAAEAARIERGRELKRKIAIQELMALLDDVIWQATLQEDST